MVVWMQVDLIEAGKEINGAMGLPKATLQL
jgi:hypothetical protein